MPQLTRMLSVVNRFSSTFYAVTASLWAGIILVLTLTPGKYVPSTTLFSYDKLGHAGIFCIQALLLMLAFYRSGRFTRKKAMWSGFVIAIVYGLAIEFIQNLIPDRGMELLDALANTAGSFLALLLFIVLIPKKNTESL